MSRRVKPAAPVICAALIFALALSLIRADESDAQATEALWLADHAKLVHKVNTLVIGDVDLQNVDVTQAIDFLRRRSKIADPDHDGINFVILQNQPELKSMKISMHLKKVTVGQVLGHFPLVHAFVSDFVVELRLCTGDGIWTRTFHIPNNSLAINPSMLTDKNKLIYDVRPLFEAKGLQFAPGESAVYSVPDKQLTVVAVDNEKLIHIDELLVYGFKSIK